MSNASELFTELLEGKYKKIKQMVEEQQEEGLFIDFKEKTTAHFSGVQNDDKKIYAKALSGFSNADGGVLVWGIEARPLSKEEPDVAVEMKPIKHLKKFLTDLNSLISDAIVPLNTGIQNIAIFINDDSQKDEGFIISFVPSSEKPPHRAMCKDNKYYTRAGDNFILMEHYMLEDAFGRRQKPKLEISTKLMRESSLNDDIKVLISIEIKNSGKYLASHPAIRINPLISSKSGLKFGKDIHGEISTFVLRPLKQSKHKTYNDGEMFIGGRDTVIHPGTSIEVTRLEPTWHTQDPHFLFKLYKESVYEFECEIFAEGFLPVKQIVSIPARKLIDFLKRTR
ncbi:hypothetical protein C5G87_17120 [Paenibacillus peoriae]|uniref:AlbA family DNA-binding domain-containing protein n=1 Tax=Paenibacillus peoriae TaxID=59893 RepID=UPI000CEC59C3|nr:ATP-binding protein [Paenibacillus peoriae]PPQ47835.1 hypothetical protein C5G87_17120 [Paenibacillus peoriae]